MHVNRRMSLSVALGEAGDLAGEVEQLQQALKLEPGYVHARYALGYALSQLGRLDDAFPGARRTCRSSWPS